MAENIVGGKPMELVASLKSIFLNMIILFSAICFLSHCDIDKYCGWEYPNGVAPNIIGVLPDSCRRRVKKCGNWTMCNKFGACWSHNTCIENPEYKNMGELPHRHATYSIGKIKEKK